MSTSNKISHSGVIDTIQGDTVFVRILQASACASCKVASHCNASEAKEKIIEVRHVADANSRKVGDSVMVSASRHVASRALLLGFGLPFLLLVGVLVVTLQITGNEGLSALSALLALLPYYAVLWLFRESIQQQLTFSIE